MSCRKSYERGTGEGSLGKCSSKQQNRLKFLISVDVLHCTEAKIDYYPTPLYSTLLYSALLYSILLHPTVHYTALPSTLLQGR